MNTLPQVRPDLRQLAFGRKNREKSSFLGNHGEP